MSLKVEPLLCYDPCIRKKLCFSTWAVKPVCLLQQEPPAPPGTPAAHSTAPLHLLRLLQRHHETLPCVAQVESLLRYNPCTHASWLMLHCRLPRNPLSTEKTQNSHAEDQRLVQLAFVGPAESGQRSYGEMRGHDSPMSSMQQATSVPSKKSMAKLILATESEPKMTKHDRA